MQYNILDSLVQRLYDIIDGFISVLQEHGELPLYDPLVLIESFHMSIRYARC